MIVDDYEVVRRGFAIFLRAFADLELVGEAQSGAEAIELCEELKPHVVLMDLAMPDMDGITATRALREVCADAAVLALTSHLNLDLVEPALEAGAVGYVLKTAPIDDIARAIRAAGSPGAASDRVSLRSVPPATS